MYNAASEQFMPAKGIIIPTVYMQKAYLGGSAKRLIFKR
jgi:hypothetical protein